jgi:c-di-GMP-binding flagellar brake protein YcgR
VNERRVVLPRIQQKVELQILHGPYAAAYSTVVDDVDDSGITVAHPLMGGRIVPLRRGESVRVEFAVSGAARIAFLSTVEAVHRAPYPVVRLVRPDPAHVARFQQRSFVRLPISIPLRYRRISEPVPNLNLPLRGVGEMIDLSASGVQVALPEVLMEGDSLLIEFTLAEETFSLFAEVVRKVGAVGLRSFAYGLRYLEVDESQRQAILRFIFAQQRERRRLGLL